MDQFWICNIYQIVQASLETFEKISWKTIAHHPYYCTVVLHVYCKELHFITILQEKPYSKLTKLFIPKISDKKLVDRNCYSQYNLFIVCFL